MSTNAYHVETLEHRGFHFRVEHWYDDHSEPPWERSDGHGPVRLINSRDDKRPGERILHSSRDGVWLYDWQEATKIAKRDGWGLGDDRLAKLREWLKREPTRGEIVKQSVENDFDFLAGWLNDKWHYMGVVVRLDDEHYDNEHVPEGKLADMLEHEHTESLWGIESDCDDYIAEIAIEQADTIIGMLPDDLVMRTMLEASPNMRLAA